MGFDTIEINLVWIINFNPTNLESRYIERVPLGFSRSFVFKLWNSAVVKIIWVTELEIEQSFNIHNRLNLTATSWNACFNSSNWYSQYGKWKGWYPNIFQITPMINSFIKLIFSTLKIWSINRRDNIWFFQEKY